MDSHCYGEDINYETLMQKQNSLESLLAQLSHACADIRDIDYEADPNKTWVESEEVTTASPVRSEPIKSPVIQSSFSLSQVKNSESSFLQLVSQPLSLHGADWDSGEEESLSIDSESKDLIEPQRRRASVVRLQAAQSSNTHSEVQAVSGQADPEESVSEASGADFNNSHQLTSQQSTQFSASSDGHLTFSSPTTISSVSGSISESNYSEDHRDSDVLRSTSHSDEDAIPDPHEMQRFLMSDGQYVYGCRDASGEFQFFYPTANDRESHNEKERERRSRVSEACNALRKLVPGLCDKTDKASVFEHAARYLQFLRNKYGTQFDKAYGEKYFIVRT